MYIRIGKYLFNIIQLTSAFPSQYIYGVKWLLQTLLHFFHFTAAKHLIYKFMNLIYNIARLMKICKERNVYKHLKTQVIILLALFYPLLPSSPSASFNVQPIYCTVVIGYYHLLLLPDPFFHFVPIPFIFKSYPKAMSADIYFGISI